MRTHLNVRVTVHSIGRLIWSQHIRSSGLLLVVTFFAVPLQLFATEPQVIPPGTSVSVRTLDAIESRQTQVGQSYRCTIESPILISGTQIVARGADCVLRIVETKDAGHLTGKSELKLELAQIRVDKDLVDVGSDPSTVESAGKGKSTAVKTGVGTAVGAGLGGLFGGKRGAAIGAGAWAGAGVATAALTHGPEIKVAPETVLNFVIH
jgi:hypothetical protein